MMKFLGFQWHRAKYKRNIVFYKTQSSSQWTLVTRRQKQRASTSTLYPQTMVRMFNSSLFPHLGIYQNLNVVHTGWIISFCRLSSVGMVAATNMAVATWSSSAALTVANAALRYFTFVFPSGSLRFFFSLKDFNFHLFFSFFGIIKG